MFLCEITLHIYRKESLQSWISWVSYGMSIQSTISYRKLTMLQLDCFVFHMDHYVYAPSQWEMMLHCNIISHWLGAYTKLSLISYHMFHFLPYLHSAHFLQNLVLHMKPARSEPSRHCVSGTNGLRNESPVHHTRFYLNHDIYFCGFINNSEVRISYTFSILILTILFYVFL